MTGWVISGLFFISASMMGYSLYYKKILHKKLIERTKNYITQRYENLENLWHKGGLIFVVTENKNIGTLSPDGSWKDFIVKNFSELMTDNNNEKNYILGQLKQAEKIANKNGYAVAIGHPKSQTYAALKEWLPTLEAKGLKLVHMSEIVELRNKE